MTTTTYPINFQFTFDPTHKGAPYSFDGEHWCNGGEFAEIADKAVKGLHMAKDANSAYDAASDIAETNTSIKSSKATLTSKVIGYDYDSVKAMYFATVHSTNWDWVSVDIINQQVTIYNMDATEFADFMDSFASFQKDRKVIRFKAESKKMLQWFEERA